MTDVEKLRRNYTSTFQFKLDIVSLLPTDLLYLWLGTGGATIVRVNRVARLGRAFQFIDRTEAKTSYPNIFRIVTLVVYILIIIHWNACIYIEFSGWIGFGSDLLIYPMNIEGENGTFWRMYLYGYFWSTLTLTTIADIPQPTNDAEYCFLIVDFLTGVLIFATIVGKVGSMVSNMNAQRAEFQQRLDGIKRYMEFRKVWYCALFCCADVLASSPLLNNRV